MSRGQIIVTITVAIIYVYSVLLSLTMFICDLRVIKNLLGVSKDKIASNIQSMPLVLGITWSTLGGTRIFLQSATLTILSWNLRVLSTRKYVEMVPNIDDGNYTDDDDNNNENNNTSSLKSIVESKEGVYENDEIENNVIEEERGGAILSSKFQFFKDILNTSEIIINLFKMTCRTYAYILALAVIYLCGLTSVNIINSIFLLFFFPCPSIFLSYTRVRALFLPGHLFRFLCRILCRFLFRFLCRSIFFLPG